MIKLYRCRRDVSQTQNKTNITGKTLSIDHRKQEEQLGSLKPHKVGCLDEEKPLKLTAGSFYLSKGYTENHPGEDSHFTCPEKHAFGVADGVSGWSKRGIDPGLYAKLLMRNSLAALAAEPRGRVNPKRVLWEAYANTNVPGTPTACIVALSNRGTLTAANVGDSGFMVFRKGKPVYQSLLQYHGFNKPYQLGTKEYSTDGVSVAEEIEVPVHVGDIIVAGTDGMLDNLHPEEIDLKISKWEKKGSTCPRKLARSVGIRAWYNSRNQNYCSPFQIAAGRWGYRYTGGKRDDITVVVGIVKRSKLGAKSCEISKEDCSNWPRLARLGHNCK